MRINSNHGSQPLPESDRSNTAKTNVATSQAFSRGALGEDQAQLSGAGAQVTALAARVLQLPEIQQERVQSLRLAVQSGKYAPDPQAVAGALIDHLALKPAA